VDRRKLEAALKLAEHAVALDEDFAPAVDTLAEIHFQMGHDARAIALMERCIALEPDRSYYQRQLARMKAGLREVPPNGQ